MPDLNRTRPAAYLPDEMEDVQPPPERHLPNPKSVNKGQGPSKELAPKQPGEAHGSTRHEAEKKEKRRKQTTRARHREKSQSTRKLSSDPEREEESDSKKSGSDEGTEDSEIKIVERPQRTNPAALPRPRVEEHIMQEGKANCNDRVTQLEKKVEYYKNLSETRLNDIVQWMGGHAPRPPWALPPASGPASKTIKTENVKTEGDDLKLTVPKHSRKKKGDNPTVKSLDEVDLANGPTHVRTRLYKWMSVTDFPYCSGFHSDDKETEE
ncbi:hypothetical protein RSOLAG22IIIB_09277 [Rhizoctonia solani]|uniref:Uncharacterized protein n=1 Tax=Rhizoctonia solani TaxID=456999 RepID=A0A0K6FXK5_9AGAM|nr:hypothetical protein RSOLAG22IIIB_09277 [Rhizoctonia solani]